MLGNTISQGEKLFQSSFFGFPVQFDVFPPFGEGHNSQKGDDNNFDGGIAFLSVDSRIFEVIKKVEYGWYGFEDHCAPKKKLPAILR
jgi:hypothetical protein